MGKYFCSFFGRIEDRIICLLDFLTFKHFSYSYFLVNFFDMSWLLLYNQNPFAIIKLTNLIYVRSFPVHLVHSIQFTGKFWATRTTNQKKIETMKNSWCFLFCLIAMIFAPNFTNAYPLSNYEVTFRTPYQTETY